MAIKHSITLSTTEPNNEVGVIKIRQADEQTQTLQVQITENGVPKSYQGLSVYFCAKLGQTAGLGIIEQKLKSEEMTNPANGKLEYTMRAEDWQILGRQRGYFSFRKMKDEHEFIEQFTTRDFTFEVIKSVYSDGLKEVKKDGSTYVWTIEDLTRRYKEYIATGKTDWEEFVEQNREVLESVDPGGKLIGELIDARRPFGSEAYATLGERLDSEKAEVSAQLAQKAQKSEVRNNSVLIGINDIDTDLTQAIAGNASLEILSMPRAKSVSPATISEITNANLLNKNNVTTGYYLNDNGVLTAQGPIPLYVSEPIPVVSGQSITISNGQSAQGGFFNETNNWVSKIPSGSINNKNTFTVPTGVTTLRVNGLQGTLDTDMVLIGNNTSETYIPYGTEIGWLKVGKENLQPKSVSELNLQEGSVSFSKLKGVVIDNYFDKSTVTPNKYVDNSGVIADSAIIHLSDFIPVVEGQTFTVGYGYSTQGAVYDENKNWKTFIEHLNDSTNQPWTFTIPKGASFIRLNVVRSDVDDFMMVLGTEYPTTFTSYGVRLPWLKNKDSEWDNTTWNYMGDSLTEINSHATTFYHDIIKKELGIKKGNNYGLSGSTIGSVSNPMSVRYSSMDASADLITVFGSVNDYGKSQPLGTMSDRDNSTFYGAMHVLLSGLIDKYPSGKIGFIGFHHFGAFFPTTQNSLGLTPKQYNDAAKEVCAFYAIPFLNLYENSGLFLENEKQKNAYSTDGLHLNNEGQKWIARLIKKFIESL